MTTIMPKSDDPLAEVLGAPLAPAKTPPTSYNGGRPEGKLFEQPCTKCGGTGRWVSGYGRGACFGCSGTGKQKFKTSPEKRAANRVSRTKSRANKIEDFKVEYPDVWAWIDGNTFPPAVELREKLEKYGSLFDSSIEFARRCIAKLEAAKAAATAERTEREESAQPINTTALQTAFDKAAAQNRRVALWIGTVRIKPARSRPGILYVVDKATDTYLGKVGGGKFTASREGRDREPEVLKILQDPKAAAIEHGKLTGACAVCSRTLTDASSIAAGIGPVCATKMGW